MANEAILKNAKYICETGKVVHDRIVKIQSQHFGSCQNGAANELSLSQLHAVKTIHEAGELTMNELAEALAVSPPSASAMVDRLVDKGIVCREHSTQDRRKVVVQISPEGLKVAEEIKSNIMNFFVGLVEKIGVETAQKWCDVLACVKAVISEEPDAETSAADKSLLAQ